MSYSKSRCYFPKILHIYLNCFVVEAFRKSVCKSFVLKEEMILLIDSFAKKRQKFLKTFLRNYSNCLRGKFF